jgi:hypothetical protein
MSEQEEETTDEQKGETYKLTLEGGGVAVKREVDETTALQIIAAVDGRRRSAAGGRWQPKRWACYRSRALRAAHF